MTRIFLTSGASWSVPSDWNNDDNTIECIGGGAGGGTTTSNQRGGGGGAWANKINLSLTPGGSATIQIGSGGASSTNGGDTWLSNTGVAPTSTSEGCLAKGGLTGSGKTGGAGGAAGSCIGDTAHSGGAGGNGGVDLGCGGGGGAAGAAGDGADGGDGDLISTGADGAGGGGAANGGAAGGDGNSTQGGAGGNGPGGSGGGTGGTTGSQDGGAGSNGSGGGGGWVNVSGASGGDGGAGTEYDASHGSGAGGGGAATDTSGVRNGGSGGLYGGGGGGRGSAVGSAGGVGAQGLIIITYTPKTISLDFIPSGSQVFQSSAVSVLALDRIASTSQVFQSSAQPSLSLDRAESRVKMDFKNDWDRAVALFNQYGTFTRAGGATYFDSSGVLQTAVSNALRRNYDPVTLLPLGFLIEEGRTNSIRNNTMVGAVSGTPGTAPTNWQTNAGTGLTLNIAGVGIENGIPYVDIRWQGTSGAPNLFPAIVFEGNTQIAAAPNSVWAGSVYVAKVAGSFNGITTALMVLNSYNSSGVSLSQFATKDVLSVMTSDMRATRAVAQALTTTFTNAATAFVRPYFQLGVPVSGSVIDITLRFGMPQCEAGGSATSVIATSGSAVSRNNERAQLTSIPWMNPSEGTLITEWSIPYDSTDSIFPGSAVFTDGTDNNRMGNYERSVDDTSHVFATTGGVSQVDTSLASYTYGSTVRQAFAYKANDFAGSINGGAALTDTTGTVPVVNQLLIGRIGHEHNYINGCVGSIEYLPRRVSNTELPNLSSLYRVTENPILALDRVESSFQGFDPSERPVLALDFVSGTSVVQQVDAQLEVDTNYIAGTSIVYDVYLTGIWQAGAAQSGAWMGQAAATDGWTKETLKPGAWS